MLCVQHDNKQDNLEKWFERDEIDAKRAELQSLFAKKEEEYKLVAKNAAFTRPSSTAPRSPEDSDDDLIMESPNPKPLKPLSADPFTLSPPDPEKEEILTPHFDAEVNGSVEAVVEIHSLTESGTMNDDDLPPSLVTVERPDEKVSHFFQKKRKLGEIQELKEADSGDSLFQDHKAARPAPDVMDLTESLPTPVVLVPETQSSQDVTQQLVTSAVVVECRASEDTQASSTFGSQYGHTRSDDDCQ